MTARQGVLREISQTLIRGSDLQSVLEESLDRMLLIGPYDAGVIGLVTDGENHVEPAASRGYRSSANVLSGRFNPSSHGHPTIRYRSLATRQTICIEDLETVEGYRSFKNEGFRTVIVAPICAGEASLGILWLATRYRRKISREETRILEVLASQLALVIQRARLHDAVQNAYYDLKAQRERMDAIIDNVPGIVWEDWWESGGGARRVPFISRYVETMLGYTVDELLGTPGFWLTIIHPDDRLRVMAQALSSTEPGNDRQLDYRYVAKDGRVVWTETRCRLIHDETGAPIGIRGVTVDISERKEFEAALRESEEQLRQSQKMEAVGMLAGGVAHDFNNLLTVINGFGELLQVSPDHPDRATYMNEIIKAGQRAAALTAQLLAFSSRQVLRPEVLDLNAVVSEMDALLRRIIGEDVELFERLDPGLGSVRADPSQLSQVVINLAANARDAMPTGGRLSIETANVEIDDSYLDRHGLPRSGRHVLLAVSDTGVGMDPDTKARMFEPFFTTKQRGKGTGLGLSTVYGIVKQSGGDIWVYSEPGIGTTIKIYLPRYDEAVLAASSSRAVPAVARGAETVMVVEDEPGVRALACAALDARGYRIIEAREGNEALEIAKGHAGPIDLVVTDLVMPGMSGRQLAGRLSALRPESRVLYMSGYTDDVALRHGLVGASVAYLQKPFTPTALAQKVREVLDSPAASSIASR